MPRKAVPTPDPVRVKEIQQEYGLTGKQAAYVDVTAQDPTLPKKTRAIAAGYGKYTSHTNGGRVLKSAAVTAAELAELKKRAKIEAELHKLDGNPKQYLKGRFLANAEDKTVTATQHASLEAIAKMEGVLVQKVEIDLGDKTRNMLIASKLIDAGVPIELPQPSEEND